jgi:hypothetical protein
LVEIPNPHALLVSLRALLLHHSVQHSKHNSDNWEFSNYCTPVYKYNLLGNIPAQVYLLKKDKYSTFEAGVSESVFDNLISRSILKEKCQSWTHNNSKKTGRINSGCF